MNSYTCPLKPEQAEVLRGILEGEQFDFREVPHAKFAAAKGAVGVVYYQSGKLVVQGKGTREFIEFTLEPLVLQEARLGYEAVHNPELLLPRLGIDESGKGDFFGPLCVAGAYVNEAIVKGWEGKGVRDSKNISSDRRIIELADMIEKTPGCATTVVCIGNEAYNRLHAKLGSVNSILAWGHARAIENLMGQRARMNPPPARAISDQFARDKATVARALMAQGREIELVQRHKAEADLAVAAASILARREFVRRLGAMAKEYGQEFPKGASAAVEEAGRAFVAARGADQLGKVAKLHFRTTQKVT